MTKGVTHILNQYRLQRASATREYINFNTSLLMLAPFLCRRSKSRNNVSISSETLSDADSVQPQDATQLQFSDAHTRSDSLPQSRVSQPATLSQVGRSGPSKRVSPPTESVTPLAAARRAVHPPTKSVTPLATARRAVHPPTKSVTPLARIDVHPPTKSAAPLAAVANEVQSYAGKFRISSTLGFFVAVEPF